MQHHTCGATTVLSTSMRARCLLTPIAASVASFGAAAGATAALSTGTSVPGTAAPATPPGTVTVTVTTPRAPKGLPGKRGPRGRTGARGAAGTNGARGAAGKDRVVARPFSINWQNDRWQGREKVTFVAPGIGQGTVICTPNIQNVTDSGAQMITFRPFDQQADTTMWTLRSDDRAFTYHDDPARAAESPVAVRAARREPGTGPEFNEGFNLKAFAPTYRAQGSFIGIISSRGDRKVIGGPGPAPTTFRLNWHWTFDDGNPRCYVAGTFFTEAT
ncbi:MAG: collagen-like protein [Conexibacter sp.]|nr:collagen-like protein [Solirubrobacterales bacterium]MCW3005074.1 collagen-like protein [Conexibacter sp.]